MAEGTVAASYNLGDGSRACSVRSAWRPSSTNSDSRCSNRARIVAGSNPFIGGSTYSDINERFMSTGRRIARSTKAVEADRLDDIIS